MKTLELRTYQQTLLREYVRRKYKLSDIPLMELDISFIEGYEYFLTIDRKLKRGSICSALAALKAVVNKAVKNGMIDMYPFIGYSYEKTKRNAEKHHTGRPAKDYRPAHQMGEISCRP